MRRLTRLATGMNKRARLALASGTITPNALLMIENARHTCHYCGVMLRVGEGQFDHQIPLDRGGRNTFVNIVRCCIECNRRKFTKNPDEFAEHQAMIVACEVCGHEFQPRYAEYQRGVARVCSRRCSALKRWHGASPSPAIPPASTTPTDTTMDT
jgi:rubredoxin